MIFGEQGTGTGTRNCRDTIEASHFTCPSSARAQSISVYFGSVTDTTETQCAIYTHVGNNNAGNLIAYTEHKDVSGVGWVTYDFGTRPILSPNTEYFLCVIGNTAGTTCSVGSYVDGGDHFYKGSAYNRDTWQDPLTGEITGGHRMCIYCTYAERIVTIANVSGCVTSGSSTGTIGTKITDGSGNVYIYYEPGATGGGEDKSAWSYSSNVGIKNSGNYFETALTSLDESTVYSFRAYMSSNGWDAGDDWANANDTFLTKKAKRYDLQIYYSSLVGENYINCRCSRWDQNNWNIIVETWMTKSQLQTLNSNITPGAVGQLYEVLGSKVHYDMTWTGADTIKLSPNSGSSFTSTLDNMRGDRLVYVKNISSSPIEGESGYLNVKIEGILSGGSI